MKPLNDVEDRRFDLNVRLFQAASRGNVPEVKKLVRQGADLDFCFADEDLDTPLHAAVQSGNLKLVKFILDEAERQGLMCTCVAPHSANQFLDAASECYGTPLMMDVTIGRTKITDLLLERGALPHINGPDRLSPLHLAAARADLHFLAKVVELLPTFPTGYGDPESEILDAPCDDLGATSLHYAAGTLHHKAASLLIEAGADVNAADLEERTPLHYAIEIEDSGWHQLTQFPTSKLHKRDRCKLVQILIAAGADVDVRDSDGRTPLEYANSTGAAGAAKALIDAGASQVAQSATGKRSKGNVKRLAKAIPKKTTKSATGKHSKGNV